MKTMEKPTGSLPDIINNAEGLYAGDLVPYFKSLFRSRGSANFYHNFRHSCEVLFKCHSALQYYHDAERPIALIPARCLLIAAIFHDFNHPGRSGNDDLNIQFAIRALDQLLTAEDLWHRDHIVQLMRTTEFGSTGHVHPVGSLGTGLEELERVIRDADVSQCFGFAWIQLICFGLGEEIGIVPEPMLRSQTKFLRSLKMFSAWGKMTYPPEIIAAKIAECEALVALLDGHQERTT